MTLVCAGTFTSFANASGEAGDSDIALIEAIASDADSGAEYDGYIVKIDDDATGSDVNRKAMKRVSDEVVSEDIVVVDEPVDALSFADPQAIESIEPNYKLTSFAFPQDDPRDWVYATDYQWGIKQVGAKYAWQAGYDGLGVNIAILDTGVVHGHEDLNPSKIINSYDFVNDDMVADDDHSHGSIVAGIIAADTDNVGANPQQGIGMAGLTDKASLLTYKVLDADGSGYVDDLLSAYESILYGDTRVDVINLSLGHPGHLNIEEAVIQKLIERGVIIVAAAGNNGNEKDARLRNAVLYPAGYDGVIGVGSIGRSGGVSDFSAKNTSVDVTAPGEMMAGLSHRDKSGTGAYLVGSGTSFSAPIVAAAAAIAKQYDEGFTSYSFLEAIKATATDAGVNGRDTAYGYGVLSLPSLLSYIDNRSPRSSVPITEPSTPEAPEMEAPAPETPAPETPTNETPPPETPTIATPPAMTPPAMTPPTGTPTSGAPGNGDNETDKKEPSTAKNPVSKYTIKFAVNGGKRLAERLRSKLVASGAKYGKLPTPKRSGYKFKGWYTKKKGGSLVKSTTVVKLKKAQTLYAHWKRK
ncbi:MAG: S8 family serine peptidase [Clostridiales Family XIII bacterium]|nr:S8 family serine peptidase [Clostridiales Family XIII bacterium]